MDKTCFMVGDVTDFRSTNVEGSGNVGLLRWKDSKCYRWVQNLTTAVLTVGRVCYGGTTSPADQIDGLAYTLGQATMNTAIDFLLGVAVSAIPINYFGWLLCYGEYASLGVEGTAAVAIGDTLKGVAAQTYMVKDAAAGTAPGNRRHAIALAAQGAGGVAATRALMMAI